MKKENKDGRESNVRNIANGNVAHYLVAGLTMCTTDHPQQYLSFLADRERKTEKEGREERHTDQKGIELAGEKERTLFSFSLSLSPPLPFSFPFIRFTSCTVREHRKRGMERQKKRKGRTKAEHDRRADENTDYTRLRISGQQPGVEYRIARFSSQLTPVPRPRGPPDSGNSRRADNPRRPHGPRETRALQAPVEHQRRLMTTRVYISSLCEPSLLFLIGLPPFFFILLPRSIKGFEAR